MQSWQAVGVVIEDTVEGAVNSIVDVVHQSPVGGPFVFLCGGDTSSLLLLSNAELSVQHPDSFSLCQRSPSQPLTVRGRVVVDDDLLGDDVDNQRVGRCHVEAAWLSDDANTGVHGEILVQGQIDDGCDLESKKINNLLSDILDAEAGDSALCFKKQQHTNEQQKRKSKETSSNWSSPSSEPGKPPPMSSRSMLKPSSSYVLKK